MIKYSILDQSKQEFTPNTTIRFDSGIFEGSIICFDTITARPDYRLEYSITTHQLYVHGVESNASTIQEALIKENQILFYAQVHDMFIDLLSLFNGDINYES